MDKIELVITAISSLVFGGWLSLKFNYNNLFAETVSKSRMEWINSFREEMSTIIAMLEMEQAICGKCKNKTGNCDCSEGCQYRFDACKARAKLRTRLNMNTNRHGNEYNKTLDEALCRLKFDGTDSAEEERELLITLSRKILEQEWQRVKKEAQGRDKR